MFAQTQLIYSHYHFKPHQVWGILGPNGCGKTTLLHKLAGFAKAEVYLDSIPIQQLSRKVVAQAIGILPQETPFTFPQTVWEYCIAARFPHQRYWQLPNSKDNQIVTAALNHVDLMPLAFRPVTKLSGGEKRRVAIAALFAQTPQFYLLDEPTNHLDISHQFRIMQFFQNEARRGATVIMSLHDVNLAQQYCDFVILMNADGKILHGPTNALLTLDNVSTLYQHPMQKITQEEKVYWLG